MFIVMPFIALALAVAFDPPQLVRVTLVALALSPVPPLLPTKVRGAGGRASYGLGLMATFSILSIVLVPVWVEFLGALMGRPFHQGPPPSRGQVLVAVAAPLAAGMLVRAFLPCLADRVEKPAASHRRAKIGDLGRRLRQLD
jgi:BASS family bile acid:Na+ symporter